MHNQKIRNTKKNRAHAIRDLQITVPYYTCRVVGNRLEFALYGGAVVAWPPVPFPGEACPEERGNSPEKEATQ